MCHLAPRSLQAGFIVLTMQTTSTRAEVKVAVPAQIFSSHLKSCGSSEKCSEATPVLGSSNRNSPLGFLWEKRVETVRGF
ncbi:hypothetical protein CesoFtcFv8_010689 [Champsocephalus esox]|uniref:Uncharacterized protein n=1 Tax=Champsocephalus esox TaxID=159716 RepID=A0AAN8C9G1_9TELE|nr:hypothetical protein CesoFtcFv8_010668 [Champsocephalus esox]KAK5897643.1 hypothetical protein CesoFtcFv8_010689 [Champsocephalus esox]